MDGLAVLEKLDGQPRGILAASGDSDEEILRVVYTRLRFWMSGFRCGLNSREMRESRTASGQWLLAFAGWGTMLWMERRTCLPTCSCIVNVAIEFDV